MQFLITHQFLNPPPPPPTHTYNNKLNYTYIPFKVCKKMNLLKMYLSASLRCVAFAAFIFGVRYH